MNQLPETGFLRLAQIIGQPGISPEQAENNRRTGRKPTRPRPEITAIIPVKKSCWWEGVRSGRFPKPIGLGPRMSAWRAEDIRQTIAELAIGGRK